MKRLLIERMRLLAIVAGMFALISVNAQKVAVDGLNYYLYANTHEAIIDNGNTWSGELVIPAEVNYDGQAFLVKSISWLAFENCKELTKVRIPKTIEGVTHHILYGGNGAVSPDNMNPFVGCTALESIEVDEDNPSLKSIGGVLFSKDGTGLYCYPAGNKSESYTVPNGVTWIGGAAFAGNEHIASIELQESVEKLSAGIFENCRRLEKVNLPNKLKHLEAFLFRGCSSLKSLTIPSRVSHIGEQALVDCSSLKIIDIPNYVSSIGSFAFQGCMLDTLIVRGQLDGQNRYLFTGLNESAIVFTLNSQVEGFRKLFTGTVLSLEDMNSFHETIITGIPDCKSFGTQSIIYDLQGRRLAAPPTKGVYVKDGRKVMVK